MPSDRLKALIEVNPEAAARLLVELQKQTIIPHAGGQIEIMDDDSRFQIICCGRRWGKLAPLTEIIPTPDGPTTMGQLKIGSEIFGRAGIPIEVTGVFPQGNQDVYRVTFSDGSNCECGLEHLWRVRTRKIENRRPWRVLTLKEIMDRGLNSPKGYRFRVPAIDPLQYSEKQLPLDPYLFGLLLGDGSFRTSTISFTGIDKELVRVFIRHPKIDIKKQDKISYRLSGPWLKNVISDLGLIGKYSYEKRIPNDYMLGSVAQRESLLQGLLDTDGCVSGPQNHHIEFCSTSKVLAEQTQDIIRSLGGIAKIGEKESTGGGNAAKGNYRTAYRVRARLPESVVPFKLKRKADRYSPSPKTLDRAIVKVDYTGNVPTQCISVNATDQLYLCKDYIPTHNTTVAAKKALRYIRQEKKTVWWVAPTYRNVKRGYREILRQIPAGTLAKPPQPDSAFDAGRSVILKFRNGSRMEFYSAERPDAMLGESVDFVVIDEAAIISGPSVWETVIRPTLMDREGSALMISTPRGRNWFYYEWLRGQNPEETAFASWRFPSSTNPHLPPEEIEHMRQSMPLLTFQQEVLADFVASAGAVFRFDPAIRCDRVQAKGHVVVGVDLAKSNDFTVFSAARAEDMMPCGYDRFVDVAWKLQRARLKNFIKRLYDEGASHVSLLIDSGGPGDPIVEEMEADGYDVVGINFTKFKQHMVTQLAKDMEDGIVRLDRLEPIHEFENYTYTITPAGKWTYGAPEGQHDDCVSAKMLQHWGIVQEGAPNVEAIPVKPQSESFTANQDIAEEEVDNDDFSYLFDEDSGEDVTDTGIPIIERARPDPPGAIEGRKDAWLTH